MNFKRLRQILVKMSKRTLHALIINCFLISTIYAGDLNAQQIKSVKDASIKIKLENADLVSVFHDIEAKTDYEFTYKKEDLDQNFRFTAKFNKATVAEVLLEISKQTNLKFRQVNNNIHISKKSKETRNEQILEVIIQGSITIVKDKYAISLTIFPKLAVQTNRGRTASEDLKLLLASVGNEGLKV